MFNLFKRNILIFQRTKLFPLSTTSMITSLIDLYILQNNLVALNLHDYIAYYNFHLSFLENGVNRREK